MCVCMYVLMYVCIEGMFRPLNCNILVFLFNKTMIFLFCLNIKDRNGKGV